MYKKKPNYHYLKSFGCLALAYNPSRVKDKFQARGVPCIFTGYSSKKKGYRLYNLLTGVSFTSRDVKFYKTIYPYYIFHSTSADDTRTEQSSVNKNQSVWIDPHEEPAPMEEVDEEGSQAADREKKQSLRKSIRAHKTPSWHSNYYMGANLVQIVAKTQVTPQFTCLMAAVNKMNDPKCFTEATQHSNWLQAINEELDALEGNNTWEIVDLPSPSW